MQNSMMGKRKPKPGFACNLIKIWCLQVKDALSIVKAAQ